MPRKSVPKLPYDVPWIIQRLRAFLLGREHNSALRWAKDWAPKTQPKPNLPLGPSSKIRFNYYCDRDPRGDVKHPIVLYDAENQQQALGATGIESSGCGPLEADDKQKALVSHKVEGESRKGDQEQEEKVVEKKEWKHVSKKREQSAGKETGDKTHGKEEEQKNKDERKEIAKPLEVKDTKPVVKDAKEETEKTIPVEEKAENESIKKEEGKEMSDKKIEKVEADKAGGKEETKVAGENDKKETNKIREKENTVAGKKSVEKEDERKNARENEDMKTRNTVNRVPGKVWHWDTINSQPDKPCCRVPRDGY